MEGTEQVEIVEEVKKIQNEENTESTKPGETDASALHTSIKTYGQNSYYYAHKPVDFDVGKGKKFEGSGLIHGEQPVLVGTKENSKELEKDKPSSKIITKYSWLDEKKKVKIYFDLSDELYKSKNITEDMVDLKVDETSLSITIVDDLSNTYQFNIKKLYDKIEPEKCKVVVSKDKIKVYLQKWIETKWRELAAKK